MTKWIYLENFNLDPPLEGIINAEFIVQVEKRIKDAQLVIFFGAQGYADPHVLTFQSQAVCQKMYDDLKITLVDDAE